MQHTRVTQQVWSNPIFLRKIRVIGLPDFFKQKTEPTQILFGYNPARPELPDFDDIITRIESGRVGYSGQPEFCTPLLSAPFTPQDQVIVGLME